MVTVSLELEQHHVGQPVGGIPAVLEAHRFRLAVLVLPAFKLYGEPNVTAAATDKPRRGGGGRLLKMLVCVCPCLTRWGLASDLLQLGNAHLVFARPLRTAYQRYSYHCTGIASLVVYSAIVAAPAICSGVCLWW